MHDDISPEFAIPVSIALFVLYIIVTLRQKKIDRDNRVLVYGVANPDKTTSQAPKENN